MQEVKIVKDRTVGFFKLLDTVPKVGDVVNGEAVENISREASWDTEEYECYSYNAGGFYPNAFCVKKN